MFLRVAVIALALLTSCSTQPSGAGRPPNSRPGVWRELPTAPRGVSPWSQHIWTGTELILFSDPGAIYDPEKDKWRKLPSPPRDRHPNGTAVWTGEEVLSWGGAASLSGKATNRGTAFNPSTNKWRLIPSAPIEGRLGHEAAWTEREMIVWGGVEQCCGIDSTIHGPEAAAFDPSTNRWRRIRDAPPGVSGDDGPAASFATPPTMLVWRGQQLSSYEIDKDRWSRLRRPSFPRERCGMTGGPASVAVVLNETIFTWSGSCETKWGRAYNLDSTRWHRIAESPLSIWSLTAGESALYASGRTDPNTDRASVWRYDIRSDSWRALPKTSQPLAAGAFVVWTGSEVLVWGGEIAKGVPPSGAAYTPN